MKRIARTLALMLAPLAASCNVAATQPDHESLYIYAIFANPNVTVRVNGAVLGQLTRQYTGGQDCASFAAVVTQGTMLSMTVHVGQTYAITWDYSNNTTGNDILPLTSDILATTDCLDEQIPLPPSSSVVGAKH
ncbi:MAG: hypothetical protein ACREPM_03545 [Gemmatimonadaceae bacterium]